MSLTLYLINDDLITFVMLKKLPIRLQIIFYVSDILYSPRDILTELNK